MRTKLSFEGIAGERVPTLLVRPKGNGPFPCVIFLHGIGQKKEFLDDICEPFLNAGYAMVTFDQYTRGERRLKESNWLNGAMALRRRGALTVIETRRLVDYLVNRPDIAADRLYLVGASYGAITGSTAAAFEPRIRAVVLTYGGGDLRRLFASKEATKELGRWTGLVACLSAYVMAPGDPIQYIKGISPRPVLFQNGTHDSLIPTESAKALYEAAAEPKEIVWYDSDHIGLDWKHAVRVLNETIAWLNDH